MPQDERHAGGAPHGWRAVPAGAERQSRVHGRPPLPSVSRSSPRAPRASTKSSRSLRQGRPLTDLLDTNIDAITAWRFGGLRVDNIPRSLWYTPQHTTSIALGLVGLLVASAGGVNARVPAIVGAGIALGLSTTMNPLLGARLFDDLRRRASRSMRSYTARAWRRIPVHALAALPVVLAVAWGAASHVMDGAGSALDFGYHGFSRHAPIVTLAVVARADSGSGGRRAASARGASRPPAGHRSSAASSSDCFCSTSSGYPRPRGSGSVPARCCSSRFRSCSPLRSNDRAARRRPFSRR